jgi:hypothetical protein
MSNVAGDLVEALLALHQPHSVYNGMGHPKVMQCCGSEWPCPTVLLVAEVTGSPVPEQKLTPGGVAGFHPDWHCDERPDPDASSCGVTFVDAEDGMVRMQL